MISLRLPHRLRALIQEDQAQALPLVAVALTMVLGMSAFVIDAGHARYTYRELQATTDSAALAAARYIPTATTSSTIIGTGGSSVTATQTLFSTVAANGVAAEYSSVPGGWNARTALPSTTVTTTLLCLNTIKAEGIPCTGNVPYNAVRVTQSTVMPTYFAGVLGHPTLTLTTQSTASTRGGATRPTNVAVIVDTTLSMLSVDSNCTLSGVQQTQMQCALNGFQTLLKNLQPCGINNTACISGSGQNTNPFDQVALFTFPDLDPATVSRNTNCTVNPTSGTWEGSPINAYITLPGNTPSNFIATAQTYQVPTAGASSYNPTGPTYQVTAFLNDFKTSNGATTLNPSSLLTKAAGGVIGCGGMVPSNNDGVYGTYYAGAIYAAQASLVQQQTQNPGSENVIILLSDGDSSAGGQQQEGLAPNLYGLLNGSWGAVFPTNVTASGNYPSYYGQCGQAITAAQAATAAGTLVYSVAYGAPPVGCYSDLLSGSHPGISPCDTMYYIASAPQMFYSDYQQSGSGSTCYSSQPVTSLDAIFSSIAADLSQPRLIPNNTT